MQGLLPQKPAPDAEFYRAYADNPELQALALELGWTQNMYNMIPFIASMIILAFTSKKSRAPKAEGIPYDKGSR